MLLGSEIEKMDSIYSQFMNKRSYYYGIRVTDKLFDEDSTRECCDFIKKFFRTGQKELSLMFVFKDEFLAKGRHVHTVSVFLIGELLNFNYKKYIDQYIAEITGYNFEFKYYWFLASLYHDVASCIEKINDSDEVKKSYKCNQYDIFNHSKNSIKHRDVPLRFSRETIDSYAEWRKNKGSNDHGIFAGKLLYERLLKNFRKRTLHINWEQEVEMTVRNKKYRPEQIDLFAIVADAVMCHNIWMAYDSEKIKEYEDNELNALIIRNPQERLSVNDYPLQFFLNIIDTIEPIKRFVSESFTAKDVLQNVFIESSADKITIGWTKEIRKQPLFFKWICAISELQKWLGVNVSECYHEDENCYIDIVIERTD